jgi:hypothetical protein
MGTSPWPVMKTSGSGEPSSLRRLQAGHAIHPDVDNQACQLAWVVAAQEGLGRIEAAYPVVFALKQPLQRVTHRFVVVDDINSAFFGYQAHVVSACRW